MRIVVCVKPVLLNREAGDILRPGTIMGRSYAINRHDLYALEEARRLRAVLPGSTVEAVLLGTAGTDDVLREAMARGADRASHLVVDTQVKTPREAAIIIARYIRETGFDMVLTGITAEDTGDGSMGPMLAAFLDVPFAWGVMKLECADGCDRVVIECEMEAGDRLRAGMNLPALVSVGTGINLPPYPALSARLRAADAVIKKVACDQHDHGRYEIIESEEPLPSARHALYLQGTSREKADELVHILRQRALL